LIADEVAVGIGRTGRMFACEHEEVSPDLLCIAKGITGGYLPLAVTLATDEIWQAFLGDYTESKTFFHGHTYGGNPLGAAVALATLDVFEEEQTLRKLPSKIARLSEHLARLGRLPLVGDVRQRGLIGGIELVRDQASREKAPDLRNRVLGQAFERGLLVLGAGDTTIRLSPPLTITRDQCDFAVETLDQCLQTAIRNG
jgi:adenosylmethionine-8-amino-7-oxononanoate aminotransferase